MRGPVTKPGAEALETEHGHGSPGAQRGDAATASGMTELRLADAERDRLRDELRQVQERLSSDLDAMTRLHQLGSLFVREGTLEQVLVEIVDAAIAMSGADFGNIQLLDAESSDLKIVAHRGFPDWWLEFWNQVSRGQGVCGTALERGERVIVEDVERSPIFAGTPALEIQRKAGVRAVQSTPLVSRSGKPLGMFSTHWRRPGRPDERCLRLLDLLARHAADIVERAQIEGTLRHSEEKLRASVANAAVGVALTTPEGRFLEANPAYCAITGYGIDELRNLRFSEIVHPDDVAENTRLVDRMTAGELSDFVVENRYRRKDGSVIWVRKSGSVVRGASGEPEWMLVLVEDITERKKSEERLRESEERFRSVFESAAVGVGRVALDGRFLEVNEAYARIVGYTREELLARRFQDITHPEDLDADVNLLAALLEGRRRAYHLEKRYVRKDGELVWVSLSVGLSRDGSGRPAYCSVVVEDITARTRAEAALRESEERFRAFVTASSDVVYRMSPDWSEMRELRGREFVADTDAPSRGWLEKYIYPEDQPHVLAVIYDAIRTRSVFELEHRVLRVDGSLGWTFSRAIPLVDESGAIVEWIGAASDITERKRAEEELRASEVRLRMAKDAAKMGAWNWDLLSGEAVWSDRCKALFGLRPDTVPNREVFLATLHPEDRDRIERAMNDAVTKKAPYNVEMRVLRPDGTVGWVAARGEVVYAPDGRAVRMDGMAMDVTERKHAEELARVANEKLREADRNKDQFLAMLSHELRNPLTPIRNSLYILERAAPGDPQARRAQETIQRQIGHLTWLVDDLLDVTRIAHGKIQLQRERLDLNHVAHRVVEDHRAVFAKSDVRLELLPAPAEVWVDGDRVRLSQVLGNLLQNAAKFTPHGGKTTVSVESSRSRHQAVLTVRDTGRGIQPEMMPRLFQAFSQVDSAIDRSKGGLGLGLALVKGLVEMHGGSVSAASEGAGKGAAFTVTLPLDVAADRLASAASRGDNARSTPRRVLVIEDNEDTASTLREVLEFDEHVVDVAYSGREGIERARAFHPDVVLCDISLPEIDGYEVARAMRAAPEFAGVGLVALSGYAQPEDVASAREAGFDEHLAKPPSIEALARAVAEYGSARQEQRRPAGAPDSSSRT